jgi:hypothetical protein
MTPTANPDYPYSQGDVVRVTGASMPQVKKLATQLLRKKGRGSGKPLGFNFDDTLRIAVARELLRVGVDVSSMHSLFAAIESPRGPSAHRWAWLRTEESRRLGACIVLVLPPRHALATAGHVHLTTTVDAAAWLQSKHTVIVIDVGATIRQLEEQTGEQYTASAPAPSDEPPAA